MAPGRAQSFSSRIAPPLANVAGSDGPSGRALKKQKSASPLIPGLADQAGNPLVSATNLVSQYVSKSWRSLLPRSL
jgi:hypothetical protein